MLSYARRGLRLDFQQREARFTSRARSTSFARTEVLAANFLFRILFRVRSCGKLQEGVVGVLSATVADAGVVYVLPLGPGHLVPFHRNRPGSEPESCHVLAPEKPVKNEQL